MSGEFQKHVALGFTLFVNGVMFSNNFTIFKENFANNPFEFLKPCCIHNRYSINDNYTVNTIGF